MSKVYFWAGRRFAWLIDTNVVSEMMKQEPDPKVAVFLDSIADDGLGLASITVWEILNGIGKLSHGRRRRELAARFEDFLNDQFDGRIIAWTGEDARACARIMEDRRLSGESLDNQLPDAFLAAVAAERGLTIVTRDRKDFRNTGVETVDPWSGRKQ